MDTLTKTERSKRMSLIRDKNTKPELAVRRIVYDLGYRYRLHSNKLSGKPDLVFAKRKKVIFVHGCFWHQHECPSCRISHLPKSNRDFWRNKLQKNKERDAKIIEGLLNQGWQALVVWECQLRDLETLKEAVLRFLGPRVSTVTAQPDTTQI
ncbi:Very short patch repair protein [compost metagenome]